METDKFLNGKASLERLINEYDKHKSLIIGYDFDSTVSDFHNEGHTYDKCIKLLRDLKQRGMILICWTAYKDIDYVEKFLKDNNIPFDGINTDGITLGYETRKPFFNALLDDRAGLLQVYTDLVNLCKYIDVVKRDESTYIIETESNEIFNDNNSHQILFLDDTDGVLKEWAKELVASIAHNYINTIFYLTDVDIDYISTMPKSRYSNTIIVNNKFDMDIAALTMRNYIHFYNNGNEELNKYKNSFDLIITDNEDNFKEKLSNDIEASLY